MPAIGDLDGDGVPDLAAGASSDDEGGSGRGAVHVMHLDKDVLVRAVSSTTTDGTYGSGQTVDVTVKFSESVAVTGTPRLALDVSPQPRTAPYLSGNGTDTLTFRYAPQSTDESPDLQYVAEDSLSPGGGTITAFKSPSKDAILLLPDPVVRFDFNPPGAFGSLAQNKDIEIKADTVPVLGAIGAKSVNELAELAFNATATDGDALTFTLDAGAPTGASITSGGAFSWTPTEQQDGTHQVTVRVSDGNGGSDSETITVTVSEVNADPVLASVGPKSVDELESLTFTATASDGDVIGGTADTLEFSLGAGAPTGASISSTTGAFSWTPSESQDGTHTITVQVEDGAGATDSEAVTVDGKRGEPTGGFGGRHGDGKLMRTGIRRLQERGRAGVAHVHGHGLRRRRHRGDGRYPGVLAGRRRPDGRLHKLDHRRVLVDALGVAGRHAHHNHTGGGRCRRDRL